MDRKGFFSYLISKSAELVLDNPIINTIEKLGEEPIKKQRPPGAEPDQNAFLEKCTGCDLCMAACPINIIMIEDLQKRDPIIYPDKAPCIQCLDFPCIQACPTGALSKNNSYTLKLITNSLY